MRSPLGSLIKLSQLVGESVLGEVEILFLYILRIYWHNLCQFREKLTRIKIACHLHQLSSHITLFAFHLIVLPAFLVGLLVAPTFSFYISRELL